jgi:vacuolar-type H+-ATPase subunit E/Vma4
MTFEEIQLLLQSIAVSQRETQAIVDSNSRIVESNSRIIESNSRAIQAMLDQAATDRLNHEARMAKLESLSEGLINMLSSIDEDRPTILRKLNTIEQKTNSILDRLPPHN